MGEMGTCSITIVPELGETLLVLLAVVAGIWAAVAAAPAGSADVAPWAFLRTPWPSSFEVCMWADGDVPCGLPGWETCADCSECV